MIITLKSFLKCGEVQSGLSTATSWSNCGGSTVGRGEAWGFKEKKDDMLLRDEWSAVVLAAPVL